MAKTIMIIGYPGTGKSTLNNMMSKHMISSKTFAVRVYVTYLKETNDPIYEMIEPYARKNELIPKELIEKVFCKFMNSCSQDDLIILEGFPLNEEQMRICTNVLNSYSRQLDAVIYLKAEKEVIINRILNRKICSMCEHNHKRGVSYNSNYNICPVCNTELSKRSGDNLEYLEKRFGWHEKSINEILKSYKNKNIIKIDTSDLNPTSVFEKVVGFLND